MSYTRTSFFAAIAAIVALACSITSADTTFRGVSKLDSKDLVSPVFDALRPNHQGIFNIDVFDGFDDRSGQLAGSEIDGTYEDGTRMGFVPPVDTRGPNGISAQGRLTGDLAKDHGTWMGGGDPTYVLSNGRVSRSSADSRGVNCLGWRVTPDLGNFYLLDASVDVADGETVSIGYFGDISVVGAAEGLDGDVGLLVLNVSRDGTDIDWEVKWEGDLPGSLNGSAGQVALGEDVSLQLGWMDNRRAGQPDLFEAWMGDSQLVAGDMGSVPSLGINNGIDVFGIGFELSGTASSIDSFAAAVPEPTSNALGLLGVVGLLALRRRRNRQS